ncbi:ABC transporter substrate-binding protein [Atopobacter phocae]|uniref:ABC transporter substrate-binding protein n=1 Tax=Atopobacter phocae TaxID=136492 RepID=UPI00046F62E8|nr:ABC transporter substrate-binding protein [Atopobacter phocae]
MTTLSKKITSALALMAGAILVGCTPTEEAVNKTDNKESEPKTQLELTFGTMPATEAIPVYIAEEQGFFKEEGLDITVESFKAPTDREAAISSGSLDGTITDLIAFSNYRKNGLDWKLTSEAVGYFSIVSNNDEVKTLEDLSGKSIAYIQRQAPHYFLDEAMQTIGKTSEDTVNEAIPQIPVRLESTANKQVDATILPEPFRSMALQKGMHEIVRSDKLDIHPTGFAFTTDALENKKEAVLAFYRAYNRAVDYMEAHDLDEYYSVLEEKIGFSPAIKDTFELPKYTHAKPINVDQFELAMKWAKAQGLYTEEWDQKDFINNIVTDVK